MLTEKQRRVVEVRTLVGTVEDGSSVEIIRFAAFLFCKPHSGQGPRSWSDFRSVARQFVLRFHLTRQYYIIRFYRLRLEEVESRCEMGYHARTPHEPTYSV